MGMGAGGGGGTASTPNYRSRDEKLQRSLVVEDVKIIEKEIVIEIPVMKNIEKEQFVYTNVEEKQVKYVIEEIACVKYVPKEEETIKYKVVESETFKYVPKEIECEKPILVNKNYERPIITEKEYTLVTFKDLEAIKEAMVLVPKMIEEIKQLKAKLVDLRNYKLVEEEIKVPNITYVPTPVERIVWKDVVRERVTNANKD